MDILYVKERLSDAITEDAREAQGPYKSDRLPWIPDPKSFGFKVYRKNEYAKMDADNSQIVAYYINGDIYVTHSGHQRSLVNSKMKGEWTYQTLSGS